MPKSSVLGRRRSYRASSFAALFVLAVFAACSGTDRPPAPPPAETAMMDGGFDATTPVNNIDSSLPQLPAEASSDATSEAAFEAAAEDAAPDGPLDAATGDVTSADITSADGTTADAGMEASSDGGCTSAGNDADVVLMMCGTHCVNVDTDPANCGGCSQNCGTVVGSICDLGTCKCPDPQSNCGSNCVDTSTDSSNCGICGHNCQGDMCVMGLCQANEIAQVTGGNSLLAAIAVDSKMVYWTQNSPPGTFGKPFASSLQTPPQQFGGTADPRGLVVDLNNLFWVDYSDGSIDKAGVVSHSWSPIVPPIDPEASVTPGPLALAVDPNNVYWVDYALGTVNQVPRQGGAITTLASGRSSPTAIAVDATSVYWIDYASGSVNKVPIGQQSPITALATSENQLSALAVDATNVYWTDGTNPGTVKSVPIGGGTVKILAQNQGSPAGIAVDSQYVYWTNYADNEVAKAPIGGGKRYVIASGQSAPSAIVVDDKSVYWANQGNGTIYKVAK